MVNIDSDPILWGSIDCTKHTSAHECTRVHTAQSSRLYKAHEPLFYRGCTMYCVCILYIGTKAAEHEGCNWSMQDDWWLQPRAFALGILLVFGLQHNIRVLPVFSGHHLGFSDIRLHQQNFKNENYIESLITVVPQVFCMYNLNLACHCRQTRA